MIGKRGDVVEWEPAADELREQFIALWNRATLDEKMKICLFMMSLRDDQQQEAG